MNWKRLAKGEVGAEKRGRKKQPGGPQETDRERKFRKKEMNNTEFFCRDGDLVKFRISSNNSPVNVPFGWHFSYPHRDRDTQAGMDSISPVNCDP